MATMSRSCRPDFTTTATTGDVVTAIEIRRTRNLLRAVSSGGLAHAAWKRGPAKFPIRYLRLQRRLDANTVYQGRDREDPRYRRAERSTSSADLSGGVDSTVAAMLVHEAIGDRQTCIFVNNGLLRYREFEDTLNVYNDNLHLNVRGVDASQEFYARAERRQRSRAKTQGDRRQIHRHFRRRGDKRSAMSSGSFRERSIRT